MITWAPDKRHICEARSPTPPWPLRTPLDAIRRLGRLWSWGVGGSAQLLRCLMMKLSQGSGELERGLGGYRCFNHNTLRKHYNISHMTSFSLSLLSLSFLLTCSLSHVFPPSLWCMHTGFFLSLCISPFLSLPLSLFFPSSSPPPPSLSRHFCNRAARLHFGAAPVHSAASLTVSSLISRAGIGSVTA